MNVICQSEWALLAILMCMTHFCCDIYALYKTFLLRVHLKTFEDWNKEIKTKYKNIQQDALGETLRCGLWGQFAGTKFLQKK